MKNRSILFLALLTYFVVSLPRTGIAQYKLRTLDGTVVEVTGGARWLGIIIRSGSKRYVIETDNGNDPSSNPRVVGREVEKVGTHIRVFYKNITSSGIPNLPAINATKIINLDSEGGGSLPSNASLSSQGGDWNVNKSWQTFWVHFSTAVKKRDRAALKRMMANPFDSGGGGDYTPDKWLKFIDNPLTWRGMRESVAAGTRSVKSNNGRPRRTSRNNYLVFEFGPDGLWRWIGAGGD